MDARGQSRNDDHPRQNADRNAQPPKPPKGLRAKDGPNNMKRRETDHTTRGTKCIGARAPKQKKCGLTSRLVGSGIEMKTIPGTDGRNQREYWKPYCECNEICCQKILRIFDPAGNNRQQDGYIFIRGKSMDNSCSQLNPTSELLPMRGRLGHLYEKSGPVG